MGACGKAGNLQGKLIDGGNPFEGPRSEEYPLPPMKLPYAAALFEQASKSLGYHPYPNPAAALSQAYTNPDGISRPGCAYCGFCDRFGCMIGAKARPIRCCRSWRNKRASRCEIIEKLRDTIAHGRFDTIIGPIQFTGVENLVTPAGFLQVQNGVPQQIWPPNDAVAQWQPKKGY